MRRDRVAQHLEFAIDAVLSEHGREGARVEEDVDVLGESLDQVPAFRQTGGALEDNLVANRGRDDAERFGDVAVLLDERRPQAARRKVLGGLLAGVVGSNL